MKSIPFFLSLFLPLFFLSPHVKGQNLCAELFKGTTVAKDFVKELNFDQLFPSVKNNYPILSKIITNRLYSRSDKIRNHPEWRQLQDLIKDCSTAACTIQLNSDVFSFNGDVQITRESGSIVLNISISHFIAANAKPAGKKKIMIYKEHLQGINMQFLNLMSILFSSVHYAILNNPEISVVRITGKLVVNNNLAKVLKDLGFQPGEKDPLTMTNIIGALSIMGVIPKIAGIHNKGMGNTSIKIYGGSKAFLMTGFGVYEFFFNKNRIAPRNWMLELKL